MSGSEFVDAPEGGRRSIFIYPEEREGGICHPELHRLVEDRFSWFMQTIVGFNRIPNNPLKGFKMILEYNCCAEGFSYPIHNDAYEKIFSTVIYISPDEGDGTVLYNSDGENPHEIPWKPNCGIAFFRDEYTLHSYHSTVPNRRSLNIILAENDEKQLKRIRYQP